MKRQTTVGYWMERARANDLALRNEVEALAREVQALREEVDGTKARRERQAQALLQSYRGQTDPLVRIMRKLIREITR